jgi:hypothetical protein
MLNVQEKAPLVAGSAVMTHNRTRGLGGLQYWLVAALVSTPADNCRLHCLLGECSS